MMAREPLLGAAEDSRPELLSAFAPALVNTLKSILGTGLLAIPHEFARVGVPAGLVLTAVVGTWSCYTMHLIAHCTLLTTGNASPGRAAVTTFGELVALALGRRTGAVLGTSNLVLHQVAGLGLGLRLGLRLRSRLRLRLRLRLGLGLGLGLEP